MSSILKRNDKSYAYYKVIIDYVLDRSGNNRGWDKDHFWFVQIGDFVAMVDYVREGSGCCTDRIKLWQSEAFRGEKVFCVPCFEAEWCDDSVTVTAYRPGDWEKELFGHIGADLKRREAECQREIENNY